MTAMENRIAAVEARLPAESTAVAVPTPPGLAAQSGREWSELEWQQWRESRGWSPPGRAEGGPASAGDTSAQGPGAGWQPWWANQAQQGWHGHGPWGGTGAGPAFAGVSSVMTSGQPD